LRARLTRGEDILSRDAMESPPLDDFSVRWLTTYAKVNNKPAEYQRKESVLRTNLIPFFGSVRLSKIKDEHIERYKASRIAIGLTNKTINNHLTVLSKLLSCASEWGAIESVPRIRRLKEAPTRFDYLTEEEGEALLSAIGDSNWYGMILTGLRTGMRVGEMMALDWSNVSLERGVIAVRQAYSGGVVCSPKSNRERHIPICADLMEWLNMRPCSSGLVFHEGDGVMIRHGRAKRVLADYCRQAKLRKIGWHALRHSFASQLVMKGVSISAIQQLLGHSDIRTTMRYSHLTPSVLADAVHVLMPDSVSPKKEFGQQVVNAVEQKQIAEVSGLPLLRSTNQKTGLEADFLRGGRQRSRTSDLCNVNATL